MIRPLALLALLVMLSPGGAVAQSLASRPSISGIGLPAGETTLANGAVAYRPAGVPRGPLPLVVILHGAGGYPLNFLEGLEPEADRRGAILLYPRSRGRTWDLVENLASDAERPWMGPDARRIDQALADLFARAPIDKSHVVLLGFSDGASYALSLGTANPQLFTAIVALSPGMFVPPRRFDSRQRIFVAHGRSDPVLSFASTQAIVDDLRRQRASLRFRPFDGVHEINQTALAEALDFALAP